MKHKLSEVLLFRLSKDKYREVRKYMLSSMEKFKDDQQAQQYSLLDALTDFLLGRKYWIVLLQRPYITVRGTKGKHPYETSSDIFFSESEAWEYFEMMKATAKNSWKPVTVLSFRTKEDITVWNIFRDPNRDRIY